MNYRITEDRTTETSTMIRVKALPRQQGELNDPPDAEATLILVQSQEGRHLATLNANATTLPALMKAVAEAFEQAHKGMK